jgi:hypothetical protein
MVQRWDPASMYEQELFLLDVGNLYAHNNYFIVGTSQYEDINSDKVAY